MVSLDTRCCTTTLVMCSRYAYLSGQPSSTGGEKQFMKPANQLHMHMLTHTHKYIINLDSLETKHKILIKFFMLVSCLPSSTHTPHTQTSTHTNTHTQSCTHMHARTHAHTHTHTHTHMHVHYSIPPFLPPPPPHPPHTHPDHIHLSL